MTRLRDTKGQAAHGVRRAATGADDRGTDGSGGNTNDHSIDATATSASDADGGTAAGQGGPAGGGSTRRFGRGAGDRRFSLRVWRTASAPGTGSGRATNGGATNDLADRRPVQLSLGRVSSLRDGERVARIPAHVWRIAIALATGSVLAGLDTSLVNVGLATIADRLHTSFVVAQWTGSAYLLALAAALPTGGWLSRRHGSGRLWLAALVGFTVMSALCAAAPDIAALVAARVLQGLAGGLLIPTGMAILGQAAGPERMGRVIALSSVPAILAPAVGPVVGALLVANLSWRWLFLVNVPVAIVGMILGLRWVPRGERERTGGLDLPSLALIALGLPLVVLSITDAGNRGSFGLASVWVPAVAAAGTLALFVRRSRRLATPLLDLRPAANRVFRAAACEVFFTGAALFGGLVVLPLYFQLQLGEGIVPTGLLVMAFSIGAAVALPLAGSLTDRHGGGVVAVAGLLLTVASTFPMAIASAHPNLMVVEFLQFVRGVGLSLAGSPGVSSALATVSRDQVPDASAEVNILSRVGGAAGSALFTVILAGCPEGPGREQVLVDAFHHTFWWLTGAAVAALAAAGWLAREQRGNPSGDQRRIRWVTNDRSRSVGRPTI